MLSDSAEGFDDRVRKFQIEFWFKKNQNYYIYHLIVISIICIIDNIETLLITLNIIDSIEHYW